MSDKSEGTQQEVQAEVKADAPRAQVPPQKSQSRASKQGDGNEESEQIRRPKPYLYPEAHQVFKIRPNPLEVAKSSCIVVLDTNVLLFPFVSGSNTLQDIRRIYQMLATEHRLLIPSQVAQEFGRHRPEKLGEMYQHIDIRASKALGLEGLNYPLLAEMEDFKAAQMALKEVQKKYAEYQASLKKVQSNMRAWYWDDPLSSLYGPLFTEETVIEPSVSAEDAQKIMDERYEKNQPPGFKDAKKPDGGIGDLLIWLTILEIGKSRNKDVLFVSNDVKTDWWHQSVGKPLYPRFELVEEFARETGGRSFYCRTFSDMLEMFDADVAAVNEARNEERSLVLDVNRDRIGRTYVQNHLTLDSDFYGDFGNPYSESKVPRIPYQAILHNWDDVKLEAIDHPILQGVLAALDKSYNEGISQVSSTDLIPALLTMEIVDYASADGRQRRKNTILLRCGFAKDMHPNFMEIIVSVLRDVYTEVIPDRFLEGTKLSGSQLFDISFLD